MKFIDTHKLDLALSSIENKKNHSLGGSIMAIDMPPKSTTSLLDKYIPLALILDYTDDIIEKDSLSYEAALALNKALHYPLANEDDSPNSYPKCPSLSVKYLTLLTSAARENIEKLPSYNIIKPLMVQYMNDFIRSQAISCLPPSDRKSEYLKWFVSTDIDRLNLITWYEHAAIQASPLRSYMLLRLAYKSNLSMVEIQESIEIYKWLGALNVLGDHMNDLKEDRINNEVNQIQEYRSIDSAIQGFEKIVRYALQSIHNSHDESFHTCVFLVLINMYMRPLRHSKIWTHLAKSLCKRYPIHMEHSVNFDRYFVS